MALIRQVGHIEHEEMARVDNVVIQETWTIPKLKQFFYGNTFMEIQSPISPSGLTECKFQLKIEFHRGQFFGSSNAQYNEIHIFYMSSKTVFLESIQLTITGPDSGLMIPSGTMIWPNSIVEARKWQGFIRMSTPTAPAVMNQSGIFGNSNSQPQFLTTVSFRLCFKFVVSIKKGIEIPATQLSNDFKNLLNAGMFSDVVMKSAEGEEFRVHKAVLASRSAVLRAHFEYNTTETITNIVETPLESAVLIKVLSFIYTDKVSKVDEIPEKLLAAADYYQLSRLKSLCEEALYKKLNVDNAVEILQLADLHSVETLKQLSLEFIKKDFGQSKLITKTEGWANLKDADLLKKIYE